MLECPKCGYVDFHKQVGTVEEDIEMGLESPDSMARQIKYLKSRHPKILQSWCGKTGITIESLESFAKSQGYNC